MIERESKMSKQGMEYDDVRKRITRLERTAKNKQLKDNLQDSLINQARIRHGEGAAVELRRELSHKKSKYF